MGVDWLKEEHDDCDYLSRSMLRALLLQNKDVAGQGFTRLRRQ
jgi:hypothetical protein